MTNEDRQGVVNVALYVMSRVALALLAALVLVVVAGCGGGGGKKPPRLPTPPSGPSPQPTAWFVPRTTPEVPCWTYAYAATAAELKQIEQAGVTTVIEYVTFPPEQFCERAAGTKLRTVWPLYHGKGATRETVGKTTRDQVDSIRCPERVDGLYVWDEPQWQGIDRAVVEAAIAEARSYRPWWPTLIAYGVPHERAGLYAGLDLKGVEFYARHTSDPTTLTKRLDALSSQPVVIIPRAWRDDPCCCDKAFGCKWTDAEIAVQIRRLVGEAMHRPNVQAVLFFTATGEMDPTAGVRSVHWLKLPETRRAITEVCGGQVATHRGAMRVEGVRPKTNTAADQRRAEERCRRAPNPERCRQRMLQALRR